MDKLVSVLITLIGIVLLLPLLGVSFLGLASEWVVALCVLIIGLLNIFKSFKNT